MSDEKIDRIDRRVTELVNITGNLVTAVTELTAQVKEITAQVKDNSEQIKNLAQQQYLTTNQLTDVARVVIETSNRVKNLEERVDEGFEEFGKEFRVANRKIDWTANRSLDALTRVEDLESRVAQIEQKIAV